MPRVGAAVVDITPPAGLPLSGFAARLEPATGAHDPLTARAIVVDDTALVVVDVLGVHAQTSRRVRARSGLPPERVVVAALHTHGGPHAMPGRIGEPDPAFLAGLEEGCVEALARARAAARPAVLTIGVGADPDVARNRRRADGPLDRALPVLRARAADGGVIAVVTAYACHPVVLGPGNRLWTADYPGAVRRHLEAAHPGAVALFLTGCAGDANTGHSARASMTLGPDPARSFAHAEAIGARIAACALAAPETPAGERVAAGDAELRLALARRETEPPAALALRWRREAEAADPAGRALLAAWIGWAETHALSELTPVPARVAVLLWGGVPLVALPGEVFAESALAIRARFPSGPGFVVGFAEDNPGYIPPASEDARGGYEVEEAHRYYGLPAAFAPGSAEALVARAGALLAEIVARG